MMVGIGVFVLTAVNIYLYHKIFHIVYFDLGKGLLKEIIGAFLAAILEIAVIQAIGLKFLGWVPKLLGGILKAAAVLVGIIAALGIIGIIYEKVKEKTGEGIKEGSGNKDSSTSGLAEEKNAEGVNTIKKTEWASTGNEGDAASFDGGNDKKMKYIFCTNCGKRILNDANFCNFCGKPSKKRMECGEKGNAV